MSYIKLNSRKGVCRHTLIDDEDEAFAVVSEWRKKNMPFSEVDRG